MTSVKAVAGLTVEAYWEGETGMVSVLRHCTTIKDFLNQIKEDYPEDVGADGFYVDPFTGDERPLNW